MLSGAARRVYLVCSILTIGLIVTRLLQVFVTLDLLPGQTTAVLKLAILPEVTGLSLLWVAMFYFWFGFDQSHWLRRAIWFVLIYFLAPYSLLLYYFFVYRKGTDNRIEVPAVESLPRS